MNKRTAEELVEKFVISNQRDCALVREGTEEFENCFAVRYQSKKFLETNDPMDQLFGHGAVLVEKSSGEIWETGSAHPVEHYVEALLACGSPFAEKAPTINIDGHRADADRKAALECVRRSCDIQFAAAKTLIDSAFNGNRVTITCPTAEIAGQVTLELAECGFRTRQDWQSP